MKTFIFLHRVVRSSTLFAVLLILAGFASGDAHAESTFEELAQEVPGFRLITNKPPVPEKNFFDGDNKPVSLTEFEGKALMVNFWATWCTPCVTEMPILNDLAREFSGEDFDVIAIASGSQVGMEPKTFLKEHDLSELALYHDPHAGLMKLFETETLPTTLLVDRDGRIVGGVVGAADWDTDAARALLASLIKR